MISPTERLPARQKSESIEATIPQGYRMQDIHDAIPLHCFEADTLRSIGLVARDYAMALVLLGIATRIPYLDNTTMRVLAWTVYGFCQGLVFTGLWELAHESGHGALSRHKWVNNAIGLLNHSILLVPFHSWQFTHRTHHKGTNHLDRDIAFMPEIQPPTEVNAKPPPGFFGKAFDLVADCPLTAFITLFFHQLIAFPIYLAINNFALARMREYHWWKRSHFYLGGDGPNFRPEHFKAILISDLALGGMVFVLWALVQRYGGWNIFLLYGLPYLWTNHWICKTAPLLSCPRDSRLHELLTFDSNNYIPATHGHSSAVLFKAVLVIPSRRCINNRP